MVLSLLQAPTTRPAPHLDVAYGELEAQKLDLHLPAGEAFPTVVFAYGGGWHSGSGKSCAPIADMLSAHGYACALVSHRLFPPEHWPAMIEDVATAFAWVHAHVVELGGDAQRVFAVGHSSGAQLSLLLATDPRWLAEHHLAPGDVAGVVGLSTPLDLAPRADGKGYGDVLMMGRGADVFARDPAVLAGASPTNFLTRALPPTLLVVGEHDFPMLEGDARAFVARARELNRDVDLVIAPKKDHMGVVTGLADVDDAVSRAVLEFLDRVGSTREARGDEEPPD